MSSRAPAILLALVVVSGCSRHPAPPARAPRAAVSALVVPTLVASREREEREREHGPLGENSAEEIMERVRDVSPYAPDETGLAQLARDAVDAATRGDRARLEQILGPVVPTRETVRLALTFEGDRQLGPYLTAPSLTTREQLVARAQGWARMTDVRVSSATGAEIQQGRALGLDPAMGRIASMLRPLVRFYRITLSEPGTANRVVLESFVYVGGRWQFVPEPWRFAPGEPARHTTTPTQPFADQIRAMPSR